MESISIKYIVYLFYSVWRSIFHSAPKLCCELIFEVFFERKFTFGFCLVGCLLFGLMDNTQLIKRSFEQCGFSWNNHCWNELRPTVFTYISLIYHGFGKYQFMATFSWWIRTHISLLLLLLDLITCAEIFIACMSIYTRNIYARYHVTLVVVEVYLGATSCLSVAMVSCCVWVIFNQATDANKTPTITAEIRKNVYRAVKHM